DAQHVHLADRRMVVAGIAVHLGPVEAHHSTVPLRQQEPCRVEPRLGHPDVQVVQCPAALVGQAGAGTRVELHPALVHLARPEAPVPDMQHDVLGQRVGTDGIPGRVGEGGYLADLIRRQMGGALDRCGGGHRLTVAVPRWAHSPAAPASAVPRTCTRPGGQYRSWTRIPTRAWPAAAVRERPRFGYPRSSRTPTPRAAAGPG